MSGLTGHGGFCPSSSRARTGQGCFLPTLLPSGDGRSPACPSVPRISLLPHPHECVSRTPTPYSVCRWTSPDAPRVAPGIEGGGSPSPAEEPPAHASSLLHPGRGGRDPAALGELQGSPPVLQEVGCRLPPLPALECLLCQLGVGAARAPLSRQGQGEAAVPAGRCPFCWAHRRGSLSSSALVWCLEPGSVSALPNRDLQLGNAPRCASVSPGLEGGGRVLSLSPRQMLCVCVQPLPTPALACPPRSAVPWDSFEPQGGLPHGSLS